jgi:hypothetical protein
VKRLTDGHQARPYNAGNVNRKPVTTTMCEFAIVYAIEVYAKTGKLPEIPEWRCGPGERSPASDDASPEQPTQPAETPSSPGFEPDAAQAPPRRTAAG